MSEFWRRDAMAQAKLVREKSVRPLELVEAAIARISGLNPKLNAVVTPMFDRARAEAAVTPADGPFTGVPFLLKDLLAEYAAMRGRGDAVPPRRAARAGAPVGRPMARALGGCERTP